MKVCANCEQPMPPGKRPHAVYCSRSCKGKAHSKRNPETSEQMRARYLKEREHRLAYAKKYQKEHPEVPQRAKRKRKALLTGNGVYRISVRDWNRELERHGNKCFYCKSEGRLTMDHVIPASRGGVHSIGNLVPACKSCNSSKRDRTIMEWRLGLRSPRQKGMESGRTASSTQSHCGTDLEKDGRRQMVVAGKDTGLEYT